MRRQPPEQANRAPLPVATPIDADRERACHAANATWAVVAWRQGLRTSRERLEQLRRSGRLYDESHPIWRSGR